MLRRTEKSQEQHCSCATAYLDLLRFAFSIVLAVETCILLPFTTTTSARAEVTRVISVQPVGCGCHGTRARSVPLGAGRSACVSVTQRRVARFPTENKLVGLKLEPPIPPDQPK